MGLSVAVQMDPIERINIQGDSTFALLLEAQARGHRLLHYTPDRLRLNGKRGETMAEPLSVKDVKGDYRITDKILSMIRQARLVVADLTHERPNVYFELGFARGLDKTVITILRAGTVAHFDVQDWTHLEYFDSRPLETDLVDRFKFELQNSDG